MKSNFIYDKDVHSLIVYKEGKKAYSNISMGEIILGFDKKGNVLSVEMLNPDILYNIDEKILEKIKDAEIIFNNRGSLLMVSVVLLYGTNQRKELPITVPLARAS